MDRLTQRTDIARKALTTLQELVGQAEPDPVTRDAAIQRFEYTFETVWKAAQAFLVDAEGIQAGSPKAAARECGRVGVLSGDQIRLALAMTDDRNLTVHTYNESLANAIYERLAAYAALMDQWLAAMRGRP